MFAHARCDERVTVTNVPFGEKPCAVIED